MNEELEAARAALETTLFDQGKSKEYIEDFLSHYDRNLKNIADWRAAKALLDSWEFERGGDRLSGESISLRANEVGKPCFHVSPVAFGWLLDKLS